MAAEFVCCVLIAVGAGMVFLPAGFAVLGVLALLGLQGVGGPR